MKKPVLLVVAAVTIGGSATAEPDLRAAQNALIHALRAHHVLVPGRRLVKAAYLCSLRIDGREYLAVDIFELVPGAMEPRGVARVEVLTPLLVPVRQIPYAPPAAPLFCLDDSLFFFGDVDVGSGSGNRVTLMLGGRSAKVSSVDPAKLPAPLEK